MIPDVDRFVGIVLARLVQAAGRPLLIEHLSSLGTGFVLVDGKAGVHVKYSTKRLTPWSFTFHKDQIQRLVALATRAHRVAICLVCERDGVVTLDSGQLWTLLGEPSEINNQVSITASRRRRHHYTVSGTKGILKEKISDADFGRWFEKALT